VDIARDLRLFASPPASDGGRRAVVDVNRTVESALSLTRGQLLERARIERDLGDVPPVVMDDGRLGQIMVNLLVNAAQAIPKSYDGDHHVTVTTRSDGHTVEIEVVDTGVGVPAENVARIWQPFFTTKGPDVGTGLGLSISREIVERAGGTISVESPVKMGGDPPYPPAQPVRRRSGEGEPPPASLPGARFVIRLPAAGEGETPTDPPPSPMPVESTASARVLIVEDEPALARALADEIGRWHETVVARSADA